MSHSKVCEFCKKDYTTYKAEQIFCSLKCRQQYAKSKQIDKVCITCGKSFSVRVCEKHHKFCSLQCYHKSITDKKITRVCQYCGNNYQIKKYVNRKKRKYCSVECRHKALRKGNTSFKFRVRSNPRYLEWRRKCFERDKYTCKVCGKTNTELNVHHIVHFNTIIDNNEIYTIKEAHKCDLLWDVTNGITLCVGCHRNIHFGVKDEDI